MTDKPVVMLAHPVLEKMGEILSADYQVEKLWAQDRPALFAGVGKDVECIVEAGEVPLPPELLSGLPKLKLIACVSVGFDGVDVPWCRANGIEVTHAPGLNAADVADFAIGMMIAAYRGILEGDQYIRAGQWRGDRPRPRGSLTGKTCGIVGLGRIGERCARRAEAFEMKVMWWGPREKPQAPWPRAESMLDLAKTSDVLIVTASASPANKNLIGGSVIEALGKRGCLVNVARGSIVDEDAVIAALKSGALGSAALDVFWEEPTPLARWRDVPNTLLTPHVSGATADTVPKMIGQCIENMRRHFAGEALLSPVPL
jgi:lactate dehydrogenase-like 2-hydroxyacid dehydrogenase